MKARLVTLSVLSVFAFGNCMGAIDGALSKIAEALSVDHTVALYAGSVPALTSMVTSLVLGVLAGRKLPYKATAVLCAGAMILTGVLPCLAESFGAILAARCCFGLGLGGIMSLQNPIATRLIPQERRAAVLGLGTCVAFTVQCILQLVGGVLADRAWNLVFLTHLLLLIPFVAMVRLLPSMEVEPAPAHQNGGEKLPAAAVLLCVVMGIVTLNLAPLLFGSAFYVAALSDSATVAAVIAMLFSLGCMAGGLLYARMYRKLKQYSLPVFLLIGAAGLALSATAGTIPLLGLGFFIGGISFASVQAGVMLLLGLLCPPGRLGFASGLMMVLFNLGGFLCSSWEVLIGKLTGDALYAPLLVGMGIFLLLALALALRPLDPRAGNPRAKEP